MRKPTDPDTLRQAIKAGFALLEDRLAYSQAAVQQKMDFLGHKVSRASFNNILNDHNVGRPMLLKAHEAMTDLLARELGFAPDDTGSGFVEAPPLEWRPEVVPTSMPDASEGLGFRFMAEGRLSLADKLDFMATAKEEVVEFGIRLHTFANYFLTRNETEFRSHVIKLMNDGVTFKLYLLNPKSREGVPAYAQLYFEDRAKVMPQEAGSVEEAHRAKQKLLGVAADLWAENPVYRERFQLYQYEHIPYCHFLVVDGDKANGRLLVSPYLYGIRRADCPVIRVEKEPERALFRKYYNSFLATVKDAERLLPTGSSSEVA